VYETVQRPGQPCNVQGNDDCSYRKQLNKHKREGEKPSLKFIKRLEL